MENSVYLKIHKAKALIKEKGEKLKKKGYNEYSKYHYFTPEQVEELTSEVCNELNIFNKYDLIRNELGLEACMEVIDLDSFNSVKYIHATDMPDITATNTAQKLGGTVTFSERYLLMTIYGIKDNNNDYDTTIKPKVEKKQEPEKWLNKYDKNGNELSEYWVIVNRAKEKNMSISDLRNHYKISKPVSEQLKIDLS